MCSGLWYHCISAIRDVAYGGATWRVMFEKIIGLLSSVPPLARWRDCVPIQVSPLLIRTLSEVDRWKTVHPSAKVTWERHICGMSTRDGKSVGVAERFPCPVGWSQGTLKRGFFGKFDPSMETFLECETMCREPPPGHVFMESLVEIHPRKVAEVVRGSRHKKQRLCDQFFRALSETHSTISLETCNV